jgi:RNA polymerase sporulation-specific sigma factor
MAILSPEEITKEIEQNLGLIIDIARKRGFWNNPQIDHDEIIQVGQIGIMRALETFQEDRGAKKSSWLGTHILKELQKLQTATIGTNFSNREKSRHTASLDAIENYKDIFEDTSEMPEFDSEIITMLMQCLDPDEKFIIASLLNGARQAETAGVLNTSRQAVSIKYKKAIEKMRFQARKHGMIEKEVQK